MARPTDAQLQFDALSLEGSLLAPEWLAKVASLEAPSQTPADYGVPKGLQLRDELGRYWRIAEAAWTEFVAARSGPDALGASHRFARDVLTHVFGFADLVPAGERIEDGRKFPIAFAALGERVPVIVGPYTDSLDQNVALHGDGTRRRSAWGSLQEYLNAADSALWGIAANGLVLRVGRDNSSMTRPAWLEADLERIFTEQRFADFSVLWLLIHASRFGRADRPVQDCPLEQWRNAGRAEGSRARESLRVGVEEALLALGQGFLAHPANVALRESFASGSLKPEAYFNELLRLVYRMIFLVTVEERGILHSPDGDLDAIRLYAEGYGMRRLRERALRHSAHDRHTDLWASIRPVFAALGRADGGSVLALPALGGLFAADQCAHLDTCMLENSALLNAVFRLAWIREGVALARVNWKDMGVEEFGSVYESLLELVPVVSDAGHHFGFAGADESAGNARKLTGSYYTPDVLVQQLLDTTLEPVVMQRLAEHPAPDDAERALLSLSVVDPACGSGHFLLAATRRLAGHLARLRAGGTPGADEYRHALRDVVTRCIYGVDRNPMALELARMALWLESYTPDRALGFLDHHMVCGDALLGLLDFNALKSGIPDEAFKALVGDDKKVAKLLAKLNRTGRKAIEARRKRGQLSLDLGTISLAAAFAQLDALGDEGLAGVEAKRARYAELHVAAETSALALAADCFVGAFLVRKKLPPGAQAITEQQASGLFPTSATLAMVLDGTLSATHTVGQTAQRTCREARVLHWPLAFPQVFARGGFDIVLANPPWEVSQLKEEEFFASRVPDVAALAGARRKAAIIALEFEQPDAWEAFTTEKFRYEAANTSFRGNPRFVLTAVGKLNTYALFAESIYRLTRPSGRAGIIVPTGIATDESTKGFFGAITGGSRLVSLYDFENRDALFPGVHRSYKFALLTLGNAQEAEFVFFATSVAQLKDVRRMFRLTPADFQLINPNTLTCPTFRSTCDAELTKKIYRGTPVLVREKVPLPDGNPWGLSFAQGLFNMTSNSGVFLSNPVDGSLALYEAKMIYQYDHRYATYTSTNGAGDVDTRSVALDEKSDPAFSVTPRYWVEDSSVLELLATRGWTHQWLVGWRNVCRSTDERTGIFSLIPLAAVSNSMPLAFCESASDAALLLGCMNSLACDYAVRQKVAGVNYTFNYLRQVPVPAPCSYSEYDKAFVTSRVLELVFTAWDVAAWARDLGYEGEPFAWDQGRRDVLRAELDAYYVHHYGLSRDELRYVLDPADIMGPDYPSETFRVLKQREERQFGEYRTRRLVLEAWDRLFGA